MRSLMYVPFLKHSFAQFFILVFLSASQAAFFYPDAQTSLLEHILVDTHGAHKSGFADAITPCSNYVSGSQLTGRETAAQWLRVAFHDFVTANVEAGTGGMDASIGFETLREEDSGTAFNDSLTFFRPYVNSRVSMADLIAMATVMSVGNCGGPQIPARGGRIDAIGPGPFGVPAPDTDLETTLQFFHNPGFNQVDSIKLTACGHTMGSVHHGGFPTVVGPDAVTPNNTQGGIHFDLTVDVFDPLVVHEYLNGTGHMGGALVTSFNDSSRSDLRLYQSDNNATMMELAKQGDGFLETCRDVFQRMIEVVPKDVTLSPVIAPMIIKPINASLDFDSDGNTVFTGYIRVLMDNFSIPSPPQAVELSTSVLSHPLTVIPESTFGTSVFGTTTFFPFSTMINKPSAFTSFTVFVPGSNASPKSFHVPQTASFVVPSLSSFATAFTTNVTTINFTLAALSSTAPNVKIQAPVSQNGTLGPQVASWEDLKMIKIGMKSEYNIWAGTLSVGVLADGAPTVEILGKKGETVDLLVLESK